MINKINPKDKDKYQMMSFLSSIWRNIKKRYIILKINPQIWNLEVSGNHYKEGRVGRKYTMNNWGRILALWWCSNYRFCLCEYFVCLWEGVPNNTQNNQFSYWWFFNILHTQLSGYSMQKPDEAVLLGYLGTQDYWVHVLAELNSILSYNVYPY